MHRRKLRSAIFLVGAALTLVLPLLALAPSADAVVASSGCNVGTTPAGQISTYPAWGATQSQLRLACIFKAETGSSDVSAKFTIHDFANAVWHNGAARAVAPNATVPSGSTTFTASNCAAATGFVNRSIGGTGIAARSFVKSISGACLVTLNKATTASIPAGTPLKIDNAIARTVADGVTTATSTTVTSATANFTLADEGLSFGGTNIPSGSKIAAGGFVNATTVNLDTPANTSGVSQVLTIGGTLEVTSTRVTNDATYTATNKVTSPAAKFKADDVGLKLAGTGIAADCYIASVAGSVATTATACVTVDALTHIVTIGEATTTAPATGDSVLNQGVQLDLSPTLVAGGDPCSDDHAEGFSITGKWANPGSFVNNAFATQPAGTKAIGEIVFDTSVVDYGAFIIERPALTAGDPIGGAHYDVVFPNVPTTLALCASATSPGLGYSLGIVASTPTITTLASGAGRPGTAQLRAIRDNNDAGSSTTAFLTSEDPAHVYSGAPFQRLCIVPAGNPVVNFQCGSG